MSEARRSLSRILANYVGLASMFVLGLLLIRILIQGLGADAYGLIALLGASIGIGAMFYEVIRRSLVRELGQAYHDDDPNAFQTVYNSSIVLTWCVSLACIAAYVVFYFALPSMKIPDELLPAARWFLIARGGHSFAQVVLAVPINMYLVREKMGSYNAILVGERVALISAAIFVVLTADARTLEQNVILYGFVSSGLGVTVMLVAVAALAARDRAFLPRPARARRAVIREVVRTAGWNAGVVATMMLYFPLSAFIMNHLGALLASAVWGVSTVASQQTRRVATGLTLGLDAVATRLSSKQGDDAIRRLIHQYTHLHALVVLPIATLIFCLAPPLLTLWIGDDREDAAQVVAYAITVVRILLVGAVIRSISDCWIRVLYGGGHIGRIAWIVMLGGVLNPVLAVALIWWLPVEQEVYAPAVTYSALLFFLHGVGLTIYGSRVLGVRPWAFLQPIVRPMVVTAVCAVLLVFCARWLDLDRLSRLIPVIAGYGLVYAGFAGCFALDPAIRARLFDLLLRRDRAALPSAPPESPSNP